MLIHTTRLLPAENKAADAFVQFVRSNKKYGLVNLDPINTATWIGLNSSFEQLPEEKGTVQGCKLSVGNHELTMILQEDQWMRIREDVIEQGIRPGKERGYLFQDFLEYAARAKLISEIGAFPFTGSAIAIREDNLDLVKKQWKNLKKELPIVLLPDAMSEENGEEVAKTLFGEAQVFYGSQKVDAEYKNKLIVSFPDMVEEIAADLSRFEIAQAIQMVIGMIQDSWKKNQSGISSWAALKESLAFQLADEEINKCEITSKQYLDEIEELKQEQARLRNRIAALQEENRCLKEKSLSQEDRPVLLAGDYPEFFADETKDFVLEVLEKELRNCKEGTRRYEVFSKLLEKNHFDGLHKQRREEIKNTLHGYQAMDKGRTKTQLEEMGMNVNLDGKHYKITPYGDPRYVVVLSNTTSDHRMGDNAGSMLNNMIN